MYVINRFNKTFNRKNHNQKASVINYKSDVNKSDKDIWKCRVIELQGI